MEISERDDPLPPPEFIRRVWTVIAIGVAVLLGIGILVYATNVCILAFAAVIFSVFLRALSELLVKFLRVSYPVALGLVGAALVGAVAVGGVFVLPPLWSQVQQLALALPTEYQRAVDSLEATRFGEPVLQVLRQFQWSSAAEYAMNFFSSSINALGALAALIFIAVCVAIEPPVYLNGALQLLPKHLRGRTRDVVLKSDEFLRSWIVMRGFSMAIIGVATAIGLWLMGLPFWMAIAVLTALLTLIPNIGPIIAFIPPGLLAMGDSLSKVLWVAVLFMAIQAIESYVVTPLLQRQILKLPPALILATQILLGIFAGIPGVIVAEPLVGTAVIVIRELYVKDILGDRIGEEEDEDEDANEPDKAHQPVSEPGRSR